MAVVHDLCWESWQRKSCSKVLWQGDFWVAWVVGQILPSAGARTAQFFFSASYHTVRAIFLGLLYHTQYEWYPTIDQKHRGCERRTTQLGTNNERRTWEHVNKDAPRRESTQWNATSLATLVQEKEWNDQRDIWRYAGALRMIKACHWHTGGLLLSRTNSILSSCRTNSADLRRCFCLHVGKQRAVLHFSTNYSLRLNLVNEWKWMIEWMTTVTTRNSGHRLLTVNARRRANSTYCTCMRL